MNFRGQRVLIFGDSLTHHGSDADQPIWDVNVGANRSSSAPGDILASMILDAGAAAVRTDARIGRSAHNYWGREEGSTLASDLAWKPTRVIIMLGTNDLGLNLNVDRLDMIRIRDAFAKLPNIEIWAVGPPTFANPPLQQQAVSVYSMMWNIFGASHVIDARPLTTTENRTNDGVHFTQIGARDFATNLFAVLQNQAPMRGPTGLSIAMKLLLGVVGLGVLTGVGYATWRYIARRGAGKPFFGANELPAAPLEAIYAVGEDAIQEDDVDRARKIAEEAATTYPDEWDPQEFWELKNAKEKAKWTYPKAHKSIMDDLRANGWTVVSHLKMPHATSPRGRVRLWFKPQTIHMSMGRHSSFKDAHAISYSLDTRWMPGMRFRMWLLDSKFPKQSNEMLGRSRTRFNPRHIRRT